MTFRPSLSHLDQANAHTWKREKKLDGDAYGRLRLAGKTFAARLWPAPPRPPGAASTFPLHGSRQIEHTAHLCASVRHNTNAHTQSTQHTQATGLSATKREGARFVRGQSTCCAPCAIALGCLAAHMRRPAAHFHWAPLARDRPTDWLVPLAAFPVHSLPRSRLAHRKHHRARQRRPTASCEDLVANVSTVARVISIRIG